MSESVAFNPVPEAVRQSLDHVIGGEFDISAPLLGPELIEDFYGMRGYAELARVGVPVAPSPDGVRQVDFHILGATTRTHLLEEATLNARDDSRAEVSVPAGTLAVIDGDSLIELRRRASMSRAAFADYQASRAADQMRGDRVPAITTAYAIPGTPVLNVTVGRDPDLAFSALLDRTESPLASRSHFTAAIGGLRYAAALRVHASNGTQVTYMRR